jgi:hypothetical protein
MRPGLALLILGYLLAVGFVLGGIFAVRWEAPLPLDPTPAGPIPLAEPPPPLPPPVLPAMPLPEPEHRETQAPAILAEEEPARTEQLEPGIVLEGTLVVADERGAEHPLESGSFELHATPPEPAASGPERHVVRVESGRWRFRAPLGSHLSVGPMQLGGRAAFPEEPRLDLPPQASDGDSAAVLLRARWAPLCRLRVVAVAGGQDLAGIELVGGLGGPRGRLVHPGESGVPLARDATSPVQLPDLASTQTYWARAPGFAWGRITVDHRAGGERTLALEPACELVVQLAGAPPEASHRVRLYRSEGGEPEYEGRLPAQGALHVQALAPGPALVQLEHGEWAGATEPLSVADVVLVAGEARSVTLAAPAGAAALPAVALEGRLYLPSAWAREDPRLVLARLDAQGAPVEGEIVLETAAMDALQPGELRWSAGLQSPGRWLAEVRPLQVRRIFELGASGERELEIRVSEPAELRVSALDAATGEALREGEVRWFVQPPPGLAHWRPASIAAPGGRASLVLPAGDVHVAVSAPGYAEASETLSLPPGTSEHVVRLQARSELLVVLLDGDETLPYRPGMPIHAREVGGPGRAVRWARAGEGCLLGLSAPGRYSLEVGELPGFSAPEPREVEVRAGESAEVRIPLARRPPRER